MSKIIGITQARTGSTRLPGKVLKTIGGKSLLQIHIERLANCETVDTWIIATTTAAEDAQIAAMAEQLGFPHYRGSEANVLDRYYQAAAPHQPEWVVRVTSDCPLIDPALTDEIVRYAIDQEADYCSNNLIAEYPTGLDVEVFPFAALEQAWKEAKLPIETEHVTPYIKLNSDWKGGELFHAVNFPAGQDFGHIRITVDEPSDFELIETLINRLGDDKPWIDYVNLMEAEPEIMAINNHIQRNSSYNKQLRDAGLDDKI